MANVNDGHRSRMRERMIKEGMSNFKDHEVLEVLLYGYLPRKDTNKVAHLLLEKFGSFSNVLNASPQQLMTVDGISEVTACGIAVLKEVFARYKESLIKKTVELKDLSSIIKYSQMLLENSSVEKLVVVYVDHSAKCLMKEEFTSESVDAVMLDMRNIITSAIRCSAAGVVLFHCHVGGSCMPSEEDVVFTEKLYFALASINVSLLEHIIFNNQGNYYSFFEEKQMNKIIEKYKKTIK